MNYKISVEQLTTNLYEMRKELGDIFYSDISHAMKTAKINDPTGNIFCSICDKLRNMGVKSHS